MYANIQIFGIYSIDYKNLIHLIVSHMIDSFIYFLSRRRTK